MAGSGGRGSGAHGAGEFREVSGPSILREQQHLRKLRQPDVRAFPTIVGFEHRADQQRDVLASLAERWN